MGTGPANLHAGFRDGRNAQAEELVSFLEEADRLHGFVAVRRAMREAMDVRPGMRVLDAGCGIGLEARRMAAEHRDAHVVGLDRNAELLDVARSRSEAQTGNLEWIEGDLADLGLADASFDVVRTERVLMYLADPSFAEVVDRLVRVLRPGASSSCSSWTTARRSCRRPATTATSCAGRTRRSSVRSRSPGQVAGSPSCSPTARRSTSRRPHTHSRSASRCGAGSSTTRCTTPTRRCPHGWPTARSTSPTAGCPPCSPGS